MTEKNKNNDIKVKESKKSGISEFIKRPLATEEEIAEFEEIIGEDAREEEIKEGLLEIYQDDKKDDKGKATDVSRLDIKKKHGFTFWFFSIVVSVCILGGLGYGTYYYIFGAGSDATVVDFSIDGPEKVVAGEEFFYTVSYRNSSRVSINNVRLELNYPENFIFLDSSPLPQEKNSLWQFDNIAARSGGVIKIKGKIIDKKDADSIVLAQITYTPENFSSEFKKEASRTTVVKDIGIEFDLDYSSSVLVGEENEIIVSLKNKEDNFLEYFNLVIDPLENLEIIEVATEEGGKDEDKNLTVEKIKPTAWRISNLGENEQKLKIRYKITKKINSEEDIILRFEQETENEQKLVFLEEKIKTEVMKSDLNLTLIINGSRNDQAVNFAERLNYSITYNNKGETSMKDVVIMAVLESDFLDWTTLKDENKGREKGNTLTWSKEEIGELEELKPNQEGIIDFSIKLIDFREKDLGKDFQVNNYVQYSIGNIEDFSSPDKEDIDNRSNTIISKINSDLSLKEEVRYFNEDNIPVGGGPLPPQVGETTSFKVYWTLTNNLHELRETEIEVSLPDYVSWDNKNRTSVGTVNYNSSGHKVVWQIGRLPITVYRADAEFNISITPREEDKNKIMVLLPGSDISAIDNETGGSINKKTGAKTTKLEDDEIASLNSDGRVK